MGGILEPSQLKEIQGGRASRSNTVEQFVRSTGLIVGA
jgi:hypothetical protein